MGVLKIRIPSQPLRLPNIVLEKLAARLAPIRTLSLTTPPTVFVGQLAKPTSSIGRFARSASILTRVAPSVRPERSVEQEVQLVLKLQRLAHLDLTVGRSENIIVHFAELGVSADDPFWEDHFLPSMTDTLFRIRLDEQCRREGFPVPREFGYEVHPTSIGRRIALDATPERRLAIWRVVQSVAASHPLPSQRAYALKIVLGFLNDDFSPMSAGERAALRNLVLTGFKDRDAGIVAYAWQIGELGKVIDPSMITREMFTWPEIQPNPPFNLSHFVKFNSLTEMIGWSDFLSSLREERTIAPSIIPLASIQPIHSPRYYAPGWSPAYHIREWMSRDLQKLKRLAEAALTGANLATTDTLTKFLMEYGSNGDVPYVFELKSGRRLLVDGQSRAAVLLTADRERVVPEGWIQNNWLDRIPVKLEKYVGNIPEIVILRVIALGHTLTWDDYLSPMLVNTPQ